MSSLVPERPGKLRGTVRREIASVAGAWPTPMQPMQPAWLSRAPAATSLATRAAAGERLERLPGRRVDVEGDPVGRLAPVDRVRDDLEVAQPRIGAGADHHLGDLGPGDLPHRPDVAGARGQRDQRLERREVDLLGDVVGGVLVGQQLDPVVLAVLGGQEAPDLAVGREHRRRGTELGAHVGDHVPVHRAQRRHAGPVVLDDAPEAAVDAVAAQHLQDHVLGAHPVGQLAGQPDAPDRGHPDVVGLPGHRQRDLEPAGPDREHAERAGRAGVRVRAQQRLARRAEALHVHRVRDAVAGLGEPQPPLARRRSQEQVVVGVAEVRLQQVVVDVLRRDLRADLRDAELLELEHHHRPGGVLRERLVDPQPDLAPGGQLALEQVRSDQLVGDAATHRTRSYPLARS